MKVFAECNPQYSQGIHRIVHALKAHAPKDAGLEFVDRIEEAEFRILHVIGWGSIPWANPVYGHHEDPAPGMPYAVLQYCVRTSENPDPGAWWDHVWRDARVTMSYYDLARYCADSIGSVIGSPFFEAPLGVDASVFRADGPIRKRFGIGTSGYVAETEGVLECFEACARTEQEMFHLGPRLIEHPAVITATGISDTTLASLWSLCLYVAGLRRVEGFELPAAEGLLCGARPLMFDAPHYRRWFGDMAEYVPEVAPEDVADAITEILRRPYRAVRPSEVQKARDTFNWPTIVGEFWRHIL